MLRCWRRVWARACGRPWPRSFIPCWGVQWSDSLCMQRGTRAWTSVWWCTTRKKRFGRLSPAKVPDRFAWCDALPRTALGKLRAAQGLKKRMVNRGVKLDLIGKYPDDYCENETLVWWPLTSTTSTFAGSRSGR